MPDKRKIQIARPSMGEEEWRALREPIDSGWLTQGPKVAAFERAFAERHRVKHAVAVTSATTGLHLALAALGIGPGDEVIVPSFTWIATANVVLYCGATPVFVDIDPVTFNIDPSLVATKVTPRTRAIIPVHLFGLCADIDAIRRVLPAGVHIVEDAACAAGAEYRGRPAGGLGTAGVFSFHPRKSITTGEGGMLTTDDDALAKRASALRNHGASVPEEVRHAGPKPYILAEFNLLGFNYRMTDLQAAVGLVQLKKLDRFVDERRDWAEYYRRHLRDLNWLRLPREPEGGRHAWQSFVVQIDPVASPCARDEMMARLEQAGIAARPGTHAVHMLGYYRDRFGLAPNDFPASRDADRNSMAIPLHNEMSRDDYDYVIETMRGLA
ncbi:MAG TPA: DegT/DnrJ/EryC1/StrS family aminotransferase [Stellaceae bacterium]|nr:DegT/DnrJ/EryC1/StrS family aminotransferase [Stellaceae bacterium]